MPIVDSVVIAALAPRRRCVQNDAPQHLHITSNRARISFI
jgi:hypothetical protein